MPCPFFWLIVGQTSTMIPKPMDIPITEEQRKKLLELYDKVQDLKLQYVDIQLDEAEGDVDALAEAIATATEELDEYAATLAKDYGLTDGTWVLNVEHGRFESPKP